MGESEFLRSVVLPQPTTRADVLNAAAGIVARHGSTVAAILFYGSCARSDTLGIVDLYVLIDSCSAFHGNLFAAGANSVLPPTVLYLPANAPTNLGFKVAVISCKAFLRKLDPHSADTTVWARFCQPTALAYCRDDAAMVWLYESLAKAANTAVHWAVRLGPDRGTEEAYWNALFRGTFGVELRTEHADRADLIYAFDPFRYNALLSAYSGDGIAQSQLEFVRTLPEEAVATAKRRWRRRCRLGKVLNVARLVKALFTFANGVDYVVWKLERHSGQRVVLNAWQRRHPLLAAPFVIRSLLQRGIVR